MPTPRLNRYQLSKIDHEIDDLFDLLLTRLLGGSFTGKHLVIGYDREFTLPGLFERAVSDEGGRLNTELVDTLVSTASDYVNKYKNQAKAVTKRKIQALLGDVAEGRLAPENWATAVQGEMAELFGKVKNEIHTVVASETMHASTMGLKEAVDQVNENLGIEDPVVCWIHPLDQYTCQECYRLYYLSDRKTPRVWKESEVTSEYHKRGEDFPSWHLSHPHCRGALSTVLPGFGFSKDGRVAYIDSDHREWDYQRGFSKTPTPGVDARRDKLGKSEKPLGEPLEKAVKWPELAHELKRNGWTFARSGGKHEIWNNAGVPGVNLPIKHEHKSGEIPNFWVAKYAKDAGLRMSRDNTLSPDPKHGYSGHYRKMGMLPQAETGIKTWAPLGHEGLESVPIGNIIPTNQHDEWKTAAHVSMFNRNEGHKVPPITAVKEGDNWLVDSGHEQLEAAKRVGKTHVPIRAI